MRTVDDLGPEERHCLQKVNELRMELEAEFEAKAKPYIDRLAVALASRQPPILMNPQEAASLFDFSPKENAS